MSRLMLNICAKAALVMGIMMLVPLAADLYLGNKDWIIFLRSSGLIIMISILLWIATRGEQWKFSTRFGFLISIYLWFLGIFLGALPFFFSSLHLSFAAAVFESTSTITATGGTVLQNLDHMPPGILLWRSLLCWLGGLGVIALTLLLLPNLRNDGVQFFNMESTYKLEKFLPRVNQVITGIVLVYLGLTFICMLSYFAAGMSLFDAINYSMTTMATSGVATHDSSFAFFHSKLIIITGGFFMILGSLPITFYLKMFAVGLRNSLKDLQVITFLSIIVVAVAIITVYLSRSLHITLLDAFYRAYFQFISLISTSGYTSEDYGKWGNLAIALLLGAPIIGGCSGSTSGGIKINRVVMLWQITRAYLYRLISPHSIVKCRYGEIDISDDVALSVLLFVCLYITTIFIGTIALMCYGLDLVSSISGTIGALGNMGLGLGAKIGPTGNYACLHHSELWTFTFLMLAGRLEIITLLVIFTPDFWRK